MEQSQSTDNSLPIKCIPWKCPLCNSETLNNSTSTKDYNHGIDGVYSYGQCTQCGLWRQQPRPTMQSLGDAYPLHYGSSLTVKLNPESRINCYANRKRYTFSRQFVGSNSTVFDIGCGSGFFLSFLKRQGWIVAGIDSAAEHVTYAKNNLYLDNVNVAQWPGFTSKEQSYSLVSLIHVLEHLPDPVEGLKAAKELLKPGGHLLIETPNINAFARYVYGGRCNLFDAPRHLCLFGSSTIRKCVRKAGLTPVKLITYSPSLDGYRESLRYLLQDKNIRKYRSGDSDSPVVLPGIPQNMKSDGQKSSTLITSVHQIEKFFFRSIDTVASRLGGGLTLLTLARKDAA